MKRFLKKLWRGLLKVLKYAVPIIIGLLIGILIGLLLIDRYGITRAYDCGLKPEGFCSTFSELVPVNERLNVSNGLEWLYVSPTLHVTNNHGEQITVTSPLQSSTVKSDLKR